MENISRENGPDGSNEDNDAFASIRKLFQNVNENNLIQIQNEYAIQYLKTETEKLKDATIEIRKKRIKLEDQNVVLDAQEKALRRNIESSTRSLELKTQLVATLQQQTDNNQAELKMLQDKCANTLYNFEKEYDAVKEQYENNHPLYEEFSNAQKSSLKAEVKMKILQKKLSDLKQQHKLRIKINHQLFNRSIVQFVQALVDYRKRNPENEEVRETNTTAQSNENIQRNLPIKTSNNLFDLEKLSLELRSFSNVDLPLTTFEVSRPTDYYNNDQIALQIERRNEQRVKKLQQSYSSFFLKKRSGDLVKNNTTCKPSKNNSETASNTIINLESVTNVKENKENQNSFPRDEGERIVQEHSSEHSVKQLSIPDSIVQTSTEICHDNLPNNKKINIVDIQYLPPAKKNKTDTTSVNMTDPKNLVPEHFSSAIDQLPVFNQRPEILPDNLNQTNLDNIQKPDLIVSPFFEKSKSAALQHQTQLRNDEQDFQHENILSCITNQSDDYSEEPMMNLWSPLNESVDNENNTNCLESGLNFGQPNGNNLNMSQPNPIFGKASSYFFNMFS
ncbi:hypothetical protein FQR65_LT04221 [Abscondita terminalis]|nr:hypothetical protein FQR65_LT04221 [Abscondita terminalis]